MERLVSSPIPARTPQATDIKRLARRAAELRDEGRLTARQAESVVGFLTLERIAGGAQRPRTTAWRWRVLAFDVGLIDGDGEWLL